VAGRRSRRSPGGEHGSFDDIDLGGVDDGTLIWFDPDAEGPDLG
jgi:hypothetical protein